MTLYEVDHISQSTISYEEVYIQKSSRPVANDQLNEIIAEILAEIIQNSSNVNQTEANNSIFTAKKMPTIGLKDYLNRIAKFCYCSQESLIVALIFLDRLMSLNKGFHLTASNVHRYVFCCFSIHLLNFYLFFKKIELFSLP